MDDDNDGEVIKVWGWSLILSVIYELVSQTFLVWTYKKRAKMLGKFKLLALGVPSEDFGTLEHKKKRR